MTNLSIHLIRGVSLGLEFPEPDERPEDVSFMAVLDLFIFRIMFINWSE